MEEFFNYWKNYGLTLNDTDSQFIRTHGQVKKYKRREEISSLRTNASLWNFILSGGFIIEQMDINGDTQHCILQLANDAFTTTLHPFTKRRISGAYRAIIPSDTLQLKNEHIVFLQQNSVVFSEILHIIKQRKLLQLEKIIQLRSIADPYSRFCFYQKEFRHLITLTPHLYQRQFLAISNGAFYNFQHRYLHEK